MDTKATEYEVPPLRCNVSEVDSGGYRLTVKRAGITVYEQVDDDRGELERLSASFLDPTNMLSLTGLWADLMSNDEIDEMLDAIYAGRGRDWRPT